MVCKPRYLSLPGKNASSHVPSDAKIEFLDRKGQINAKTHNAINTSETQIKMLLKSPVLVFLCAFVSIVCAHNVLLPANGKRCFFEDLKKGDELAVSFQFGNRDSRASNQLDGDFWVSSPSGRILKQQQGASHGDVSIKASEAGKFQYCFSNEKSSLDTKDVSFNIHGVVYVDVNDPNNDSLDAAVRRLSVLTHEVKNEQGYIVVRERTHRNTAESTNDRVKWWSIFQLIIVAVNSVFQIYYLKRFFEVKSIL